MCNIKRYYIIYKGQVQGVGFRYRLYQLAYKYNLTGYCHNLSNGDVSCEVQGVRVDEFLKESLNSHYFIEIEDFSCKLIDNKTDEKCFEIKY